MGNKPIRKWKIDGSKLLDAIYSKGFTIRQVSREPKVGYSERQIRKYIKDGEMPPSMVLSICSVIGVSHQFITGPDNDPVLTFTF